MIISTDKALELNMEKFVVKSLRFFDNYIPLFDIENHVNKDLYIFNSDKNIHEFLKEYDLIEHFKLNIEANHATLSGNTFEHELIVASNAGKLGSIDANRGDLLLGWDTDQFPNDIYSATMAMLVVLKQNGLEKGGLNFDAKVRRSSTDPIDLFYAHIGGIDTFAKALLIADSIIKDGVFDKFIEERYSSFNSGIGIEIMNGKLGFEEIDKWVKENELPALTSGRQELLENILNSYIY